jgi:putative transposase
MPGRPANYPQSLREEAVRLVLATRAEHPSEARAIQEVARRLGIGSAETLRQWVRRAEVDLGARPGTTSGDAAIKKRAARQRAERFRAAAIEERIRVELPFRERPSTAVLVDFISVHAGRRPPGGLPWSVEAICQALDRRGWPLAPSTYYAARQRPLSARAMRDQEILRHIAEVRTGAGAGLGSRRVWAELNRRGIVVARCTVERLMRSAPSGGSGASDCA